MPITLDGTLGITTPALTVTGATVNTGGISTAGNLTFTSTANRITGDFSSVATSRVAFQTSTTNGATSLEVIPNGTSTGSAIVLESDPALTNGTFLQVYMNGGTDARIASGIRGTGTYLPLTFYTGGSERMRIDTSGNVGIGTSSPASNSRLYVSGGRTVLAANSETYSLCLQYTTAGVGQYYVGATNSTTPDLVFSNVGGAEKMRLTNGGVLYINTTSGVGTVNLAVPSGGGWFSAKTGATTENLFGADGSGNAAIYTTGGTNTIALYTAAAERMRINSAGDIQVGGTTKLLSAKITNYGSYWTGSGTSVGDAEVFWSNNSSNTCAATISVRQDVGGANNDLKFLWLNSSGTYQGVAMQIQQSNGALKLTSGQAILNSSGRPMLNQTGGVLQVIQTTTSTAVTTTSTAAWSNTTLSATITPSSTSSRILVLIMQEIQIYSASGPYSTGMWQLLRDATVIYTPSSTANGNVFTYDYGGSGINRYNPMPITWLDSPSTTSAVTYITQIKLGSNGGNQIQANTNSPSTITLLEIAG